jgi:diacylglycerol O-acyltransferase / trehalose O-mycolyltransferase / mycolyltransferase Ag85
MRFRGLLLALVTLLGMLLVPPASAAPGGTQVVDERYLSDRLIELTVHSTALDQKVGVRLLLPPGWDREPHRRWPVLYLLHGCCEDEPRFAVWTDKTDVEELTATTEALIVMPEGGYTGFYSDWLTGPAWETFHLTELRRLLEHDYRAGQRRVIAGLSMGGFGALSYAARHPGMFRAVASFSGVAHSTYDTATTAAIREIVASTGADPDALWGDPVADADTWAAHNPYELARRLRVPVYLSSGNGEPGPLDPPDARFDPSERLLGEQAAALAERLPGTVYTDFYGPGRHSWPYWERALHRSLPMLVAALH